MSFPPSKYSPEFFKPYKSENNSCCRRDCPVSQEIKIIKKRGCYIRYNVGGVMSYNAGSNQAVHKSC